MGAGSIKDRGEDLRVPRVPDQYRSRGLNMPDRRSRVSSAELRQKVSKTANANPVFGENWLRETSFWDTNPILGEQI